MSQKTRFFPTPAAQSGSPTELLPLAGAIHGPQSDAQIASAALSENVVRSNVTSLGPCFRRSITATGTAAYSGPDGPPGSQMPAPTKLQSSKTVPVTLPRSRTPSQRDFSGGFRS